MKTLSDYARRQYPNHSTDLWQGRNPELRDHTVVVHVVGRDTAERTIGLLQRSSRTEEVAAVLVHGSDPSVVPTDAEDRDSDLDVPKRRTLIAGVAGGAIGVLASLVIGAALGLE